MQTTNKVYLHQIRIAKRNHRFFVATGILIPALTFALLIFQIVSLGGSLVKINSSATEFKIGTSGKGRMKYTFKVADQAATFSRTYKGLFRSSPTERIAEVYGEVPVFGTEESVTKPVSFYIDAADSIHLNQKGKEIAWYFFAPAQRDEVDKGALYWDLYLGVSQSGFFFGLLTLASLLTSACCIAAFYWSTKLEHANLDPSYLIVAIALNVVVYLFVTL